MLERAGLVRRGRTRTVRGGTEQYFERVARRIRTPGGTASGHTAALLQTVADEVDAAPGEPLLHLRRLRMTPQQAAALAAHLDRLVGDLPEGRASDPRTRCWWGSTGRCAPRLLACRRPPRPAVRAAAQCRLVPAPVAHRQRDALLPR